MDPTKIAMGTTKVNMEMTILRYHKVVRNISIREDQRMIIKEEISDVDVEKDTFLIQLSIRILRLSMMVSLQKVQIPRNFKLAEAEVVQEKLSLMQRKMKREENRLKVQ